MAKNTAVKRTRRARVFTPSSTFSPESGTNIGISLEAGKHYEVRGKSNLAGQLCWIIVTHNSTKYDVLLNDIESKLGVFSTIEVSRKK